MWYLQNILNWYEQHDSVSTCLCTKYVTFCLQKLGNGREAENGRRWTTFSFNIGYNNIG